MREVMLLDQNFQPLTKTAVEVYDLDTNQVVATVHTNAKGVAEANFEPDSNHGFRPKIDRKAGKAGAQSLDGAVHVVELVNPPREPVATKMKHSVHFRQEDQLPLIGMDVEIYDLATGRTQQTLKTDAAGAVKVDLDTVTQGVRPRITRRSGELGKMALSGAIHMTPEAMVFA